MVFPLELGSHPGGACTLRSQTGSEHFDIDTFVTYFGPDSPKLESDTRKKFSGACPHR